MDMGAGVSVQLGCEYPIEQIFLGHTKYYLESDKGNTTWNPTPVRGF